ncbi:uncharacterized protein N7458_000951 [Penicillium daleae]|uniref:Ribosomal RNA methyltransferase FtsJ domain-containing protein n=1 Tax=Penicillium daleae TaxID=63821 RepID=A0AAD6G8B3_9EURO|nr:uncharacterized protein N7458_000951 [Penicillium daleae]KAJ5465265.1 hypothetical protein N7458_000951 [Penicillium daleae]
MAPGGFSATAKKYLPGAVVDAVTLPSGDGGFEVIDKEVCQNIEYADIMMYARKMAFEEDISSKHPDHSKFQKGRPFLGNLYDIVICGGVVGKSHQGEPYREKPKGFDLVATPESWDTVCILNAFNQFSDVQLYKHPRIHAIKPSFYLIAKNVNLEHPVARTSISYWKDLWKYLTFKEFTNIAEPISTQYGRDDDFVGKIKDNFGPRFLEMIRPVWRMQDEALRKASFTQHAQQRDGLGRRVGVQ